MPPEFIPMLLLHLAAWIQIKGSMIYCKTEQTLKYFNITENAQILLGTED